MHLVLTPHPDTPPSAVRRVAGLIRREDEGFVLAFHISAEMGAIVLPEPGDGARRDELWRTTCFEAFVRAEGSEDYLEFNFAPSRNWAAYAFDSYRAGMRPAPVKAPFIDLVEEDDGMTLMVELFDGQLDAFAGRGPVRVALTAVIEETGGVKSYWALKHAPGKPDFHHPEGFVLELP